MAPSVEREYNQSPVSLTSVSEGSSSGLHSAKSEIFKLYYFMGTIISYSTIRE